MATNINVNNLTPTPRRNRRGSGFRLGSIQKTTNLSLGSFIYPYFVIEGRNKKEEIKSFPGVYRFSVDTLLKDIKEARKLGIDKILLFGVPSKKDALGQGAYTSDNIISKAVMAIKKEFKDIIIFTDICLCAYTTHGHCGIINSKKSIDHQKTLSALARIAVAHAKAGADWVAPSAMAKKQVAAIRKALDKQGFKKTKILGYSAKFASNFYGPFREVADSSPKFGDRGAYQLNFSDAKIALKEIKDDIKEGADMVMVKPALSYLDIIKDAAKLNFPLTAYNVSGEYAMVKYGARFNLWDEKKMVLEILTSIKRAGANWIITYHAKDVARWLN